MVSLHLCLLIAATQKKSTELPESLKKSVARLSAVKTPVESLEKHKKSSNSSKSTTILLFFIIRLVVLFYVIHVIISVYILLCIQMIMWYYLYAKFPRIAFACIVFLFVFVCCMNGFYQFVHLHWLFVPDFTVSVTNLSTISKSVRSQPMRAHRKADLLGLPTSSDRSGSGQSQMAASRLSRSLTTGDINKVGLTTKSSKFLLLSVVAYLLIALIGGTSVVDIETFVFTSRFYALVWFNHPIPPPLSHPALHVIPSYTLYLILVGNLILYRLEQV